MRVITLPLCIENPTSFIRCGIFLLAKDSERKVRKKIRQKVRIDIMHLFLLLIMKKCPFCSEEIQETAKKCKHCGEWLLESNSQKNNSSADNIRKVFYWTLAL